MFIDAAGYLYGASAIDYLCGVSCFNGGMMRIKYMRRQVLDYSAAAQS